MTEKKETAIVPRREIDSLVPDAVNMTVIAKKLLDSGMWPQFKNEAQVFAAAEYGRELGIPPVMSLNTIFPVKGKLSMTADAMLAVAHQRAAVTWKVDSSTVKGCTMTFMRPGFEPIKVTFDEADAKAAGLLGKDNWINYPKAMYLSKAKSSGIRIIAPDSTLGLYSIDEMEDITPDVMPKPEEIKEAEVVKEKEPEPVKNAKEKPKEEPKPAPGPEPTELDKTKGEIVLAIKLLVEKYNHVAEEMIEKIQARTLKVFGRAVERIPEDLTEKEAAIILNALRNTLEAEQAAAAKEEEEAEKGGAL
jgi:hypothetical protein